MKYFESAGYCLKASKPRSISPAEAHVEYSTRSQLLLLCGRRVPFRIRHKLIDKHLTNMPPAQIPVQPASQPLFYLYPEHCCFLHTTP
jgi:hypothetical protein